MDVIRKLNVILDRKTKLKTISMAVFLLVGALMELVGVSIVLPVINLAVQPEEVAANRYCRAIMKVTGRTDVKFVILALIGIMAFVYIFKAVYLIWMNNTIYSFASNIQASISVRLMRAYLYREYPFFLTKNSSEIIRGIASDTSQFKNVIQNCMMLASSGCMSLVLFYYLLKTNFVITMLVGGLSVICILLNIIVLGKRLQRCGRENQKLASKSYRILFEAFHGVKETKILQKEPFFVKNFQAVNKKQVMVAKKSNFYQIMPKYILESVAICGILVYLAGAVLLQGGYAGMIGQLSVFAVAAFKLLPAINAIYSYVGNIFSQKASVDLVYNDILECEAEQEKDYRYVESFSDNKLTFEKGLELKEVSFQYSDADSSVLHNVNMFIPKGSAVGIIGTSGGGKTTTIDIILGLLEPNNGSVLVDGVDIRTNYAGWLNRIGYIPQDIYLSDASIRDNIAYGLEKDQIDENKLSLAVKKAQLEQFIESLPEGLDTEVGEAGVRLSGGQRQRIGIARALYNDPEVLILDEATSALDNTTEMAVMEAVENLQKQKTLIIIAHRLSTVEKCDKIYEIKNGTAVERAHI